MADTRPSSVMARAGGTARIMCLKRLTLSDACTSKQIKLPRAAAEQFISPIPDRDHKHVDMLDEDAVKWTFSCTRYNCQYALSKIGAFAAAHNLAENDYMIFYFEEGKNSLRVAVRRKLPSTLRDGTPIFQPTDNKSVQSSGFDRPPPNRPSSNKANPKDEGATEQAAEVGQAKRYVPERKPRSASASHTNGSGDTSEHGHTGSYLAPRDGCGSQQRGKSPGLWHATDTENVPPSQAQMPHNLRKRRPVPSASHGVVGVRPPGSHLLQPAQLKGPTECGQVGGGIRLQPQPYKAPVPVNCGRTPLTQLAPHVPSASAHNTPYMGPSPLLPMMAGIGALSEPHMPGPRRHIPSPLGELILHGRGNDGRSERAAVVETVPHGAVPLGENSPSENSKDAGAAAAEALTMLSTGSAQHAAAAKRVLPDGGEARVAHGAAGPARNVRRRTAGSTSGGIGSAAPAQSPGVQAFAQRHFLANAGLASYPMPVNQLMAQPLGMMNPYLLAGWQQHMESMAYMHMLRMSQLAAALGGDVDAHRGAGGDLEPPPGQQQLLLPWPARPMPRKHATAPITQHGRRAPAADVQQEQELLLGCIPAAPQLRLGSSPATSPGITPPVASNSMAAATAAAADHVLASVAGSAYNPTPVMVLLQTLGHQLSDTIVCCKTLTEHDLAGDVQMPSVSLSSLSLDARGVRNINLCDVHGTTWPCTLSCKSEGSAVMLHGLLGFFTQERAAVGDMMRIGANEGSGTSTYEPGSVCAHSIRLLRHSDVASIAAAMCQVCEL